jgi:hypothetical protein
MRSDHLEEIATILARGFLRFQKRRTLQVSDAAPVDDSLACPGERSVHVNAVG